MKISNLPEPYRRLAEHRRKRENGGYGLDIDELGGAFDWWNTSEGSSFWAAVCFWLDGRNADLPEIFIESLHEIMTIEEIRNMPGSYTLPGFTPGNLYAFWDGDDPKEWTVARYSHSEQATPFDRHWTEGKRYFANMGTLGAWTKGCPASREILAPEEGA